MMRRVGKLGSFGDHVVSARAVTGFAADRVIGRFRPGLVLDRAEVGRVAAQTAALAVAGIQGPCPETRPDEPGCTSSPPETSHPVPLGE